MKKIALSILLSLGTSTAEAANLQVGPGQTYTTIQACADAAQAGDSVLSLPGDYDERVTIVRSGTSENPITFKASGVAKVKACTIVNRSYITIDGFEITHQGFNPDPLAGGSRSASIYMNTTSNIHILAPGLMGC